MNILAVVAHPDDELMCAGTLARFADEGHTVWADIGFDSEPLEIRQVREQESKLASTILGHGLWGPTSTDENDFRFDQEAVARYDQIIGVTRPDIVITHRTTDTNQTHATIGHVMRAACRKNRCSVWLLDQTIPGGWDQDARPNHFVDISDYASTKRRAIEAYQSQCDRYPGWADAIEARDRYYGWMVGTQAAEGFIIEKSLWL